METIKEGISKGIEFTGTEKLFEIIMNNEQHKGYGQSFNINIERPSCTVFAKTESEAIEAMLKTDFTYKHLQIYKVVEY